MGQHQVIFVQQLSKLKIKKMKTKIVNYLGLLKDYLHYLAFHDLTISIIYPICIIIVLLFMLYAKVALAYDFYMIAIYAIKLLIIELSFFFTVNIVLFTFDYPFSILRERNGKIQIEKALIVQKYKHLKEKEEIVKREREVGRQLGLKKNQEIYEKSLLSIENEKNEEIKKLENEKNELSQRLENEIFSDEYKSFKKANDEHFKFIKKNEERHKKIVETTVKYVLLELDFLVLDGQEKMFITNVIKTFVNTGLMPNKMEFESKLTNRYNIKSKIYITITRYELAHLASNLAKYLDKELKEIAKLCAYIFACEDDVYNICKDAKKGREEDRIKLIDDIEEYVKSKEDC